MKRFKHNNWGSKIGNSKPLQHLLSEQYSRLTNSTKKYYFLEKSPTYQQNPKFSELMRKYSNFFGTVIIKECLLSYCNFCKG